MSIHVEQNNCIEFWDLKCLEEYTKLEQDNCVMVPIKEFINNNSAFHGDKHYGSSQDYVSFNEDGFSSFCRLCRVPRDFINTLKEDGLASRVLNDIMRNEDVKKRLIKYQFVLDQRTKVVSGVVSNSYLGYSNHTFIQDLKNCFPKTMNEFSVEKSYIINTRLYLRMLSPKINIGFVWGKGGKGDDVSKVGVQLSNSTVGNSAIKASFFIYRLVCANGLIVDSTTHSGLVIHTGKEETLTKRIEQNITPVLKHLRYIPQLIKNLGAINYDVEKFVSVGGAKKVYEIIPLSYWESEERKKLKGKKLSEYDINKISDFPFKYGGKITKGVFSSYWRENQSMFDFINIFTEYAQGFEPAKRIEIEQKAGNLTNWILANKKKFK